MSGNPILVFGYGNPSRGDDALAPELLGLLKTSCANGELPEVFDLITDFQLQVEHTIDLKKRERVLFVDASYSAKPPFSFERLSPLEDATHTTHALSPQSLLFAYEKTWEQPAPPSWLLAIPGYQFELGKPLSEGAEMNLRAAFEFVSRILSMKESQSWNQISRE